MTETRFYITGTLHAPGFLARSRWPPPARADDPPHTVYDPIADEWKADPAIGHWILNGDLKLTEIHASDVEDVKSRIRARSAAAAPIKPNP